MTISKTVELTEGSYKLEFDNKLATMVSVKVNGKNVGEILWRPYSLDLSSFVHEGENTIELTLWVSLRNLLGPHHSEEGECYDVTPASFFKDETIWGDWGKTKWNDDYCFVSVGIGD